VLGKPRASADHNCSERNKNNRRVGGSWIHITNVGSITSTAADQKCHENWRRGSDVCPFFLSVGGTRRSTLLGGKRRTNGSNMGEPISTRKEKLAGRVEHDARLGRVVQVKKKWAEESRSLELSGKKIFSNYDETKSKEGKNQKNGSKKKADRG